MKISPFYFTEMWLLIERYEITYNKRYNLLIRAVKIHICTVDTVRLTAYNKKRSKEVSYV